MVGLVKSRIHDGIAVIALDNPPVNALGAALRSELHSLLRLLADRPGVVGAVIGASGGPLSAGLELAELDGPIAAPTLREVCDQIERLPFPTIAVLTGSTLGAGLELAMSCTWRLSDPEAVIGLPDVTLGLVPGAGGTQRLPRIVGAAQALNMLMSGQSIKPGAAQKAGLVDGIVRGEPLSGGVHFLKAKLASGAPVVASRDRRDGFADPEAYLRLVSERKAALRQSRYLAPRRIADCVEAAILLPFVAGMEFEAVAHEECRSGPQSHALRHMFRAERRIDPRFLSREDGKGWALHPEGEAVAERLRRALRAAVDHLASLGVTPEAIDRALLDLGFTQVPFGHRVAGGAPSRGHDAVQRRVVAALMAEGCRMVEAGVIARASDIDAIAVHGMSYPRWRGGPMRTSVQFGLLGLKRDMAHWAKESRIWEAPALVGEAVKYAAGFEALPTV